jgi:chaperonin GroES
MATIYPLGDRIKVLPLLAEGVTKGGIVIPDAAQERPLEGIVLAVGRGTLLDDGRVMPIELEVGDVVQYSKYAGIHVPDEDLALDVVLMRVEECLGRKLRADLPSPIPGDPRAPRAADAVESLVHG